MYLLQIDQMHNRLHITLSGQFDERQADKLNAELIIRINELREGFHVLCDVTSLEEFDSSARKHYRSVMDLCHKSGVRKVVRIVPSLVNNFGLTVMSYFHYKDVPVITCRNLEEALKHLRNNKIYQLQQSMGGTSPPSVTGSVQPTKGGRIMGVVPVRELSIKNLQTGEVTTQIIRASDSSPKFRTELPVKGEEDHRCYPCDGDTFEECIEKCREVLGQDYTVTET